MSAISKIALIGNPNSGKSSLFNHLTGLNQKIGNFPGVTVEKKTGITQFPNGTTAEIIDLPGVYSVYPRSIDERVVTEILLNQHSPSLPNKIIVVIDATNIKRGMLLLTQIIDMGLPVVVALTMMDSVIKAGVSYDLTKLSQRLGVPVVPINARKGEGIDSLKKELIQTHQPQVRPILPLWNELTEPVRQVQEIINLSTEYEAYLFLEQSHNLHFLKKDHQQKINDIRKKYDFFPGKFQGAETIQRYSIIQEILNGVVLKQGDFSWRIQTNRIDAIVTHKVWGYLIFFGILFLVFQSIFALAQYPMDFIDGFFVSIASYTSGHLPPGVFTQLLVEGVIPGLGGIFMFVPQIAILFACIAVLEESGYMARVVFLMDKLMRHVGLNGKSIVPLISGMACAIPAIMSARTIGNWKERTITIFVTPLMSCSARIPVFTILIALMVPDQYVLGFLNIQGLTLMGFYLLGFLSALVSAWVLKKLIRVRERSYLIMEMPAYRLPRGYNVGLTIVEKTKAFVFEAGKIILAISVVLWVLASYGPGDTLNNAREHVLKDTQALDITEQELEDRIAAYRLENSYAGMLGKAIEPIIKPLGYDWKIGIALITSFAAREVFVGTIATIYSIGSAGENDQTIKSRMQQETDPITNQKRFTPAVCFSLLIFYTFSMQCMSTLAVVYRETKGWKWPLLQLAYMTVLAYTSAFVVYHLLQ